MLKRLGLNITDGKKGNQSRKVEASGPFIVKIFQRAVPRGVAHFRVIHTLHNTSPLDSECYQALASKCPPYSNLLSLQRVHNFFKSILAFML